MKRYQKITLSALLVGTLTGASINTSQVYASGQTIKIANVEIVDGETYVIDDKGTLYTSNEICEFNKVLDGVKQVFQTEYDGTVLILKNDNTLVLGTETKGTYTDPATGGLKLRNTWTFKEVEKNVKDVAIDDYGDSTVILKNDGSTVLISGTYYYIEALQAGESTVDYKEKLDIKAKDVLIDYFDNLYIIDQQNVLYNLGDITYREFEDPEVKPIKVLDNVKSMATCSDGMVVLTNDGKVYGEVVGYFYGNAYMYKGVAEEFGAKEDSSYFSKFVYLTDGVKAIQQGSASTFIIKNDDSLWSFGDNSYGELGIPDNSDVVNVFTKVADNVVDVSSALDATAYVTKDGKLMATGDIDYIQLTNSDEEQFVLVDENGLYEVDTNVVDMNLEYYFSSYITSDKSLWVVGESGMRDVSGFNLVNVADDVSNVGSTEYSLAYVQNGDLYYTDNVGYNYDYEDDYEYYGEYGEYGYEMTEYLLQLLELDDEYTVDEVLSDKFDYSIIQDYIWDLDEDKATEFSEKYDAYYNELKGGAITTLVASDVVSTDGRFYLTESNELYGILENEVQYKIASGIKSYFSDESNLYIIDSTGKVKFTQIEYDEDFGSDDVTFFDTGITNAKVVMTNDDYYSNALYVLDNKNTLTYYEVDADDISDVNSDKEAKEVFSEDSYINEIADNVVDFAPGSEDCYYVLSDGTLNLVDVYYDFGDTTFITNNVKAVDGNYYGDVLILKKDGKLYSKGYNSYGELGYEPDDYYYNDNSVYTPFEVNVVIR